MDIINRWKLIIILSLYFTPVNAQDTLRIDVQQANSIFLKNSFYLLASSMNIEARKAQVIQSKLYPNPIFTAEFNAYDVENNKVFHVGKTGQKSFQIEQLILLGGKRKKEIEMARTNTAIAELEFEQLTINLKYQLHSALFSAGQQESLLNKYNSHLELLDGLLSATQTQVDKGNIPIKEIVRLKGAYLKLNNDRAELLKDYFATQSTLQKILQVSSIVQFEFSENDIANYIKLIPLSELQSAATENRPELLIAQQNNLFMQQYLSYQKRLAVPDINLFVVYDQRGGTFHNEINSGISIPLPLWNRNQGNIKMAQFEVKESEYQIQAMENDIKTDIQNAFVYYTQTISEYTKANVLYNEDFEITINGMIDNFQKRNISIVEFIDFFESYNEVLNEVTRIKTQLVSSAEELNRLTGKDIY